MKKRSLALAVISFVISGNIFAGGYRVALQGQSATGMGHTGVAVVQNAEVVFFNPASISSLAWDTNFIAGFTLIDTVTKYQNQESNASAETDNKLGTPFNLYATQRVSDQLSYGIGVYTPYGNSSTWEDDWQGSHLVNNISLKTVYIQPTVSYKLNEKFSVGVGPYHVSGEVKFNRNLSTALVDSNGDRANVTVEAKSVNGWGYNVGLLFKPTKPLSFGVSYRSQVDLYAVGEEADFENIPDSMQAGFPADTTFDASLVLPAELAIGVSYQMGEKTLLAFDINRTFWSSYESLDVKFSNGQESLNPREYEDANIYRFGVQHMISGNMALRGGVYFDNTPINEGYYTPETPRNDSVGFTAGASYGVNKNMDVDFSFLYLMFDEFNGSYDHFDQSGTKISFGGDYKSTVFALGFGINYKY